MSIVDIVRRERLAEVKVAGRTRWTIYDETRELFFVNIASPARIVVIVARNPSKISREYDISGGGTARIGSRSPPGRLICA